MRAIGLLSKKKGVLLIDAMIGIFIVAIAALVYAGTISAASVSTSISENRGTAVVLLNREMESIKNVGYGNLTYSSLIFYGIIDTSSTTLSDLRFTNAGPASGRVSALLPSGKGQISIQDLSATVRAVTVTVSWTNRSGTHSVTASTEIAQLQ